MRIKTNVRAGGNNLNHNQAVKCLRVKSHVRAGGHNLNHNQRVAR